MVRYGDLSVRRSRGKVLFTLLETLLAIDLELTVHYLRLIINLYIEPLFNTL